MAESPCGDDGSRSLAKMTFRRWNGPFTSATCARLQRPGGERTSCRAHVHERKGRSLGAIKDRVGSSTAIRTLSTVSPQSGQDARRTPGSATICIVVATQRGLVMANPEDGKILRQLVGTSGGVTSIAPAADGLTFATGGEDQTIRIWRADRGRPVLSILPSGNDWIAWTEDGLYVCSPGGERLMGWQVDNGRDKLATFSPAARFRSSLYRPD